MNRYVKRSISLLLSMILMLGMFPESAIASEGEPEAAEYVEAVEEPQPHSHTWDGGSVIANATCTEAGSIVYTCMECGGTMSDVIPASGHAWGDWVTVSEATCTEAGSRQQTCAVCGETVTEEIPAYGHTWGDWTVTAGATCTEAGSRERTCTVCGEKETEEIPATGHTLGDWTVTKEPTCKEAGSREQTCSVCGEIVTEEIPALEHTWGEWKVTKEPTCKEAGERERVCEVCGEKEKEEIEKKEHRWSADGLYCEDCKILKKIADGGAFDYELDGVRWVIAGNPGADVESAATWDAMFAGFPYTGNWAEDLIAVAKSQLGYTESVANFAINENLQRKGYSRYGAWFGAPYADWCAMFVSFCLHYANISMPYQASCQIWVSELKNREMFAFAGEYIPRPGDLIFYDYQRDGVSDHVGIVEFVDEEGVIHTIEGNYNDVVCTRTVSLQDPSIMGFGILPENPEMNREPKAEEAEKTEKAEEPEAEEPKKSETRRIMKSARALAGDGTKAEENTAAINYDPDFQAEFEAKLTNVKPLVTASLTNTTIGNVVAGDKLDFELQIDLEQLPTWNDPNGEWIPYINGYDHVTATIKLPAGLLFDPESRPQDASLTVFPNDTDITKEHTYTLKLHNDQPYDSAGGRFFTFKVLIGNNGTADSIKTYQFDEHMVTIGMEYTLIGKNKQPATDEEGNPVTYKENAYTTVDSVKTMSPDQWITTKKVLDDGAYDKTTNTVTYTWLVEVGLRSEEGSSLVLENGYGRPGRDQVMRMTLGDLMSTVFMKSETDTDDVTDKKTTFIIQKYTDEGALGSPVDLTNEASQKFVVWALNSNGEIDTSAIDQPELVLNSGILVDSNCDGDPDTLSPVYTKYRVTVTYPVEDAWIARYPVLNPYTLREINTASIHTTFATLDPQDSSSKAEEDVLLPLEGAAKLTITKHFLNSDGKQVAYPESKYGRIPYWVSASQAFTVFDANNVVAKDVNNEDMTGKKSYELRSGVDYYLAPGIEYTVEEKMTDAQANAMDQTDDPKIKTKTPAPGEVWPVDFNNKETLGKLIITKKDDAGRVMSDPTQVAGFILYDSNNDPVVVGYDNNNDPVYEVKTVNGKATFDKLLYGTYTVHEQTRPEGYEPPATDPTVTLSKTDPAAGLTIDVINKQNKSRLILEKYVATTQTNTDITKYPKAASGFGSFTLQRTSETDPEESDWKNVEGFTGLTVRDGRIICDNIDVIDPDTHQPYSYRFVETIPAGYYDPAHPDAGTAVSETKILAAKDESGTWHAIPKANAPVVRMLNRQKIKISVYKDFYQVTQTGNDTGKTNTTDSGRSTTITLWKTTDANFQTTPTREKANGEADDGQTVTDHEGHADWTDLKLFDSDGNRIYYLVKEKDVTGYVLETNGQYESRDTTWTIKTIDGVRYVVVPLTSTDGQEDICLYNRQQAIPVRFWKRDKDSGNPLQNMVSITIWKLTADGTLGQVAEDVITGEVLQDKAIQTTEDLTNIFLEPGQKYVYQETINNSEYHLDSYTVAYTNGIKPSTVTGQTTIGGKEYGVIDLSNAAQTNANSTTSKYATATIYNRKDPLIQIKKADSVYTSAVLKGVQFTVYKLVNGSYVPYPDAEHQYTITTTSPATPSTITLPAGETFFFAEVTDTVPEDYLDPNVKKNFDDYYSKLNPATGDPKYIWDDALGMMLVRGDVINKTVNGRNICEFTFLNVKNSGSLKVRKYLDGVLKNGFTIKVSGGGKTVTTESQGTEIIDEETTRDLGEAVFDLPVLDSNGDPITYTISEVLTDDQKPLYNQESPDLTTTLTVGKMTEKKDGEYLAIYNSTKVSYTAKKVFIKPFEYGYTQYSTPWKGATVGLFVEESGVWKLADLGSGIANPIVTGEDGYISFSSLIRGRNYKLVELASGDPKVEPYDLTNGFSYAHDQYPAGGEETTQITADELANSHYNVIDILASETLKTEYMAFPADGKLKEMVNANHWVQFRVKKWVTDEPGVHVSEVPDPIPDEYEPVDNVVFDLYRYVMPGNDVTVTYPGDGWERINSYTTGTLYDGENRLPGQFLSDPDQNINDHYVYLLVERDIGPNGILKNPYFTYSFWQEKNRNYTLDLDVSDVFQPEGSPSAVVNNLKYEIDKVNRTDILDTPPTGPEGKLYLLASVRIAKWKDSFNETTGLPNEDYKPLPGARFELRLADSGKTLLDVMTVGLDAVLHPVGQATAQSGTYLLDISGTEEDPVYKLIDYEGYESKRREIKVDPNIVQPFSFDVTVGDTVHTCTGYRIRTTLEEVYSPDGFSAEVSGAMDMWLCFADITTTHKGESWLFNDAYYVLTGGTGTTETLAANQVATSWYVTHAGAYDPKEETHAIYPVSTGDTDNPSPLRIVNYPVDNTLVRIVKYGYQPIGDEGGTVGKNAAALDLMDPETISRKPLKGVTMIIEKKINGEWKFWNYLSNEETDSETAATFKTMDDGSYLFPDGLSEGDYQIYETDIGNGNDAYEMTYPSERKREFTVTKAVLNLSMYNPKKFNLSFCKEDMNGKKITGAKFTLKKGTATQTKTTNGDGLATFENLASGTYTLSENVSGYSSAYLSGYFSMQHPKFKDLVRTGGLFLGYEYQSDKAGDYVISKICPDACIVAKDDQGKDTFVLTVKNPKQTTIELTKEDGNGTAIDTAVFAVYYKRFSKLGEINIDVPAAGESISETNWTGWSRYGGSDRTYTTSDGKITLSDVDPGVYAFYEVQAPDGYDFMRDTSGKKIIYTIVATGGLPVDVTVNPDKAVVYDYSVAPAEDGTPATKEIPISWQSEDGAKAAFTVDNRAKTALRVRKTVDSGMMTLGSEDKWKVKLFLYDSLDEGAAPIAGVTIDQSTDQNPDQAQDPNGPEGITFKTLNNGEPTDTPAALSVGAQYYVAEEVIVPSNKACFPWLSYTVNGKTYTVNDPAARMPVTIGSDKTPVVVGFRNAWLFGEVHIKKINKDDTEAHTNLPGAEFNEVYYKSGEGENDWTRITGSSCKLENGVYKVRFPLAGAGNIQYRIRETKAPDGYLLAPDTYVGPVTLSRSHNVEGGDIPLELPNSEGDELTIVKLSRKGGNDRSGETLFAIYHKVDGKWVQEESGYAAASNGIYTFRKLMVPGEEYGIAEVSFDPDIYTRLEGIYQLDDSGKEVKITSGSKVDFEDAVGQIHKVDLYVLNHNGPKDIQVHVYNIPKTNPVIQKIDVGLYLGGDDTFPNRRVPARMDFAVYDLTGSSIEKIAPSDLTAAKVTTFLGADPAPVPVYTGNTGSYDPAVLENGTETEWNGNGTAGKAVWDNRKAYLIVETEVSAGTAEGTYDTMRKDDPKVVWFDKLDPVADENVDPGKPPVVTLKNVYGDAEVRLTKTATPKKVESLLTGDRDLVFTLEPEFTSHNQMLNSYVLKESGITAKAKNPDKTTSETQPLIEVPVDYVFTGITVGGARHTVNANLGNSFPISATVKFFNASGGEITGADVDIPDISADTPIETAQIPDTARTFEISYYSKALRKATGDKEKFNNVYSLGEDFSANATTVNVTVRQQDGGSPDNLVDVITDLENRADTALTYWKWDSQGKKTTLVTSPANDTAAVKVGPVDLPMVYITKTTPNTSTLLDATVTYRIRIENLSKSKSNFVNPVALDILPTGVSYVSGSAPTEITLGERTLGIQTQVYIGDPTYSTSEGPDGLPLSENAMAILFRINGYLEPGESIEIPFIVKVSKSAELFADTTGGMKAVVNDAYLSSSEKSFYTRDNEFGRSFKDVNEVFGVGLSTAANNISNHSPSAPIREHAMEGNLGDYGNESKYGWIPSTVPIPLNTDATTRLVKAVMGDRDIQGFHDSQIGVVSRTNSNHSDKAGWARWRLSIINGFSNKEFEDLIIGDVIPNPGDGEEERRSRFDLNFYAILSVQNNRVDVPADKYTLYVYTGKTEDAEAAVLNAMHNHVYDAFTPMSSEVKPEDVKAFIMVFDHSIKLASSTDLTVIYETRVPDIPDDEQFAKIAFSNDTNYFFYNYDNRNMTSQSNKVTITLMDKPVEIQGDLWIDEDQDGIQGDGNHRDYSEYTLVQKLIDATEFSILDRRAAASGATPTHDTGDMSQWSGKGESIKHFRFDDLGAATWKLNITDEDQLYVDVRAAGKRILDPQKLKGDDPYNYSLNAVITDSDVLGMIRISPLGEEHYRSDDPDGPGFTASANYHDNNFEGKNGIFSTYPFFIRYSKYVDQSKDIGTMWYRDLEITKLTEDDQTIPAAGAQFSVYGPYEDSVEYPDKPHTPASGKPLTFVRNADGAYELTLNEEGIYEESSAEEAVTVLETDADGKLVIRDLNYWKEYDIKEVKAAPGYYVKGVKYTAAETTKIKTDGNPEGVFTLLVPGTKKVTKNESVTVVNPRKAHVQLQVEKFFESYIDSEFTFNFELTLDKVMQLDDVTPQEEELNRELIKADPIDTASITIKGNDSGESKKTVKFKDLEVNGEGKYYFVITEQNPAVKGIQYEDGKEESLKKTANVTVEWNDTDQKLEVTDIVYSDPVTEGEAPDEEYYEKFTNSYMSEPVKWHPLAKKRMAGEPTVAPKSFTFTLTAGEDNPKGGAVLPKDNTVTVTVPAGADESSAEAFGDITFMRDGTYTFTAAETPDTAGRPPVMTYDKSSVVFTVRIRDDDGKLAVEEVTFTGDAEQDDKDELVVTAVFTNTYRPASVEIPLGVRKIMKGTLPADVSLSFEFRLTAEDGKTPLPEKTDITVTVPGSPAESFGPILFTEAGTYTYTVQEVKGDSKAVSYDTEPKTVRIIVTDEDGVLKAKVSGAQKAEEGDVYEVEITNEYTTGSLRIKKTVTGAGDTKKVFPFKITLDAEGTYPYRTYNAQGTEIGKGTVKSGETIGLAHDQYALITDLPVGCTYTVAETDNAGYTVTSTGEVGKIEADKIVQASFINNKPTTPPGVPKTGEGNLLFMSMLAMLLSAVGMLLTIFVGRKRRRHKQSL